MKIQKNISAAMNRKLREYRNQTDFMRELGVGRTTFHACLMGTGNPSADTIEILAKGMNISPAQLVAGELMPTDSSVNLIDSLVDTLHPSLQAPASILLDAQLFQLSEELDEKDARWKYVVAEPRPSCYTLKAMEWRTAVGRQVPRSPWSSPTTTVSPRPPRSSLPATPSHRILSARQNMLCIEQIFQTPQAPVALNCAFC